MAKKEVSAVLKLQCPGGQATPAPPIGPTLGQHGVNIGEFVKKFNEKTRNLDGMVVTVILTVYKDKTFSFEVKTPITSSLLKKAAGLAKASGTTGSEIIGRVTKEQVKEIAKIKMPDLNTTDINKAIKIIEGTAKSMGIEIV